MTLIDFYSNARRLFLLNGEPLGHWGVKKATAATHAESQSDQRSVTG